MEAERKVEDRAQSAENRARSAEEWVRNAEKDASATEVAGCEMEEGTE